MKEVDIDWLSVHNENDGKKYFKKSTRFDMYVARNRNSASYNTTFVDENGKRNKKVNLKGMEFIPNFDIDVIYDLIAKDEKEKVEFLRDAKTYHSSKDSMSPVKSANHRHPCIWTISYANGELKCHYSTKKDGHFGIPKVIFCTWNRAGIPYADHDGTYAVTEHAAAIIDDPKNLDGIARAMNSPEFRRVMKSVNFTSEEWNWKVIQLFRKDFWKEFT